jgi:thiol:disulfide interchange protein
MDELASIKAGREYASGFNSGMIVGLCAGAFMASVIALILGV